MNASTLLVVEEWTGEAAVGIGVMIPAYLGVERVSCVVALHEDRTY